MAKVELVNNVDHKDVKIITTRSEAFGDNVMYSMTFPSEFRSVQAYYPIFFQKAPDTGRFYPVTLFGFEDQENLFLTEQGWDAGYIPLIHRRQPFLIGLQQDQPDEQGQPQRMLQIDMDNPRVSKEEGEALFLEYGGNSEFLDRIADMMEAVHHGVQDNTTFIDALVANDLIEPFTLEVQLNDGSKHQLVGFFTINEEKLRELDEENLKGMFEKDYLQAIYMMLASQGRIRDLLNRKNAKLGL